MTGVTDVSDVTDVTDGTDRQRTLKNPRNIHRKSGKLKLRILQDNFIMGPSKPVSQPIA